MPLTFDSSATDLDLTDPNDAALREAGVWATIAVGIREVTEENVKEFFTRATFWEKTQGAHRNKQNDETGEWSEHPFSVQDIYRLVGLKTNASTLTRAQFYKKAYEAHERWNVPFRFPQRESSEALDGAAVV